MKTSVVLAAYNGEKFILEQLESIRLQTIAVDEVLIVDDCSEDKTYEICCDFIEQNNLSQWRVEKNDHNLKTVWSFWSAFKRVEGDIVFMADQDDIWLPNRVEVFLSEFHKNTQILSLATTFSTFGDYTVKDKVKHPFFVRNGLRNISFEEFCCFPFYLGMSCAFKRELLERIHVPFDGIPHEIFVNFYAAWSHGFYYLDMVLTNRRSHFSSVSNVDVKRITQNEYGGDSYLMQCGYLRSLYVHFKSYLLIENELTNSLHVLCIQKLTKLIDGMTLRYDCFKKKKMLKYMVTCMWWVLHFFGMKTLIKDMVYLGKKRWIVKRQ